MTAVLTVLSWNVLADSYVRPSYFTFTPPELLIPGARTAAIVERLVASNADVLCLQEAEPALLNAALMALAPRGFVAYFLKKRHKPDGAATFVRTGEIAIESFREITYADGAPDRDDSGHVALLTILTVGGALLGIANTHLKWVRPDAPDSERWASRQIAALLAAVAETPIPWILCGDFNAMPEDPVHATLAEAGFIDAYASLGGATSNANRYAKRIDYLVHSRELALEPLPIPAIEDDTPLPSAIEPSDHLAIAARVSFADPSR
jgi:endonuclease/exonuclease/phosphatase family metal-dependent hydrolase